MEKHCGKISRSDIKLNDNMDTFVEIMSDYDESSKSTVYIIFQKLGMDALPLLLRLDELNIRGKQIEFALSNICKNNPTILQSKINEDNLDIVNKINDWATSNKYPHRSCFMGGKREIFYYDN